MLALNVLALGSKSIPMRDAIHHSRFDSLGITIRDSGCDIKVYSESATEVWLNVLDQTGSEIVTSINLEQTDSGIWTGFSPELGVGSNYTLGANGADGPTHAFNPERQLLDPYARGLVRRSPRDYHCVVPDSGFDWQGVEKPNIELGQTIIYEAHLRGLTRLNPAIPAEIRGSYAALGHEATIDYLQQLGITAIELLPIHAIISEPRLINLGLINYWGYNSINFFTPHMRYAAEATRDAGPAAIMRELKAAIRELHRAGIEVILDVVYNHTAEGGFNGLSYSYRGLDNANYYRQDANGGYHDTTGCGNTLNSANPAVQRLVLDSLRFWVSEFQVDGFRFDLATSLARDESNHFSSRHPLLAAIVEDDVLADSKLIVEPWDVGVGGWQTGNYDQRFAEWNDRFRDSARKFWLSDIAFERSSGHAQSGIADFASRISGSTDVFQRKPSPLQGVNFITAHDGFTLADLVTFNQKQNSANGEGNRDGSNNNHSFDHGAEGDTKNPKIRAIRRRAMRNLMGSLLLSAGTPMITAGDESAKTQGGNNNAYCQDNPTSWLHWDMESHQVDFQETVRYLIQLRKAHAALRPEAFAETWPLDSGPSAANQPGHWMAWFSPSGQALTSDDWHQNGVRSVQRLSTVSLTDGIRSTMLLVIQGIEEARDFVLPNSIGGNFELLWDSALELPPRRSVVLDAGAKFRMTETSLQLFVWQPEVPDSH
ncbi:MAG: glycogen debranching protein GlgX [Actinomycetota bacterium]